MHLCLITSGLASDSSSVLLLPVFSQNENLKHEHCLAATGLGANLLLDHVMHGLDVFCCHFHVCHYPAIGIIAAQHLELMSAHRYKLYVSHGRLASLITETKTLFGA